MISSLRRGLSLIDQVDAARAGERGGGGGAGRGRAGGNEREATEIDKRTGVSGGRVGDNARVRDGDGAAAANGQGSAGEIVVVVAELDDVVDAADAHDRPAVGSGADAGEGVAAV